MLITPIFYDITNYLLISSDGTSTNHLLIPINQSLISTIDITISANGLYVKQTHAIIGDFSNLTVTPESENVHIDIDMQWT